MRPNVPLPSIKTLFLFPPREREKEENQSFLLFFHVNGSILYRKVFRAIHHVEKDKLPMYRTIFLPRKGVLLMMLRTAVPNVRGKLG